MCDDCAPFYQGRHYFASQLYHDGIFGKVKYESNANECFKDSEACTNGISMSSWIFISGMFQRFSSCF